MLSDDEVKYCRDMYLDHAFSAVKKIPMFTDEESDSMIQEIRDSVDANKLSWTKQRHNSYATRDIQIIYHSAYTGEQRLQKHAPITSNHAMDALNNKMAEEYKDMFDLPFEDYPITYDEAFVVQYSPDTQKKLNVHTDGSPLSYVCALNDDFEGGGTHFPYLEESCKPKKGECCLFSGQQHHEGLETLDGERWILTGFVTYGPPMQACGEHFMENGMEEEWMTKMEKTAEMSGEER